MEARFEELRANLLRDEGVDPRARPDGWCWVVASDVWAWGLSRCRPAGGRAGTLRALDVRCRELAPLPKGTVWLAWDPDELRVPTSASARLGGTTGLADAAELAGAHGGALGRFDHLVATLTLETGIRAGAWPDPWRWVVASDVWDQVSSLLMTGGERTKNLIVRNIPCVELAPLSAGTVWLVWDRRLATMEASGGRSE